MKIKDRIVQSLAKATGLTPSEIQLDFPELEQFGDYTTNVAFHRSSIIDHRSPLEVATEIVEELQDDSQLKNIVNRVEVAGSGFINFFLSKEALVDTLVDINRQKDTFGRSNLLKNRLVRFSSSLTKS